MKQEWPREFPGVHWIGAEEEEAALDVVRRRAFFRYYGPEQPKYAAALEDAARRYYGRSHALAVNSCTGALTTSMTALGIGPGCEVILPCFLWVATVSAIVQARAIPVLCEIDDSFTMDPADLERRITPRTRLIVVIHMAGVPSRMDAIMTIADKRGIPVLEDCAQANGGSFRGRKLGTFGRVATFSFQINKNATSGEGGLLVTDEKALYERANAAHDLGVPWVGAGTDPAPGPHAVTWGTGRRMSELCASVALAQFRKLDTITAHMRASNARIRSLLDGTPELAMRRLHDAQGDSGPFLVILLPDEAKAVRVAKRLSEAGLTGVARLADYGLHIYSNIRSLAEKVGVTPAGDPWNLPANAGSVYGYGKGSCPASDALFGRSVLIAVPSRLSAAQEEYAARAIREAVAARDR